MLKVQMANGETLTFDLTDSEQEKRWREIEKDTKCQANIRAVGIQFQGMWHVLPLPKRFRQIRYFAWLSWRKTGSNTKKLASMRLRCQADEVSIMMVLYLPNGSSPRMVRTTIKKTGRQVYGLPGSE